MTDIAPTEAQFAQSAVYSWRLGADAAGAPMRAGAMRDRSLQIARTLSGATVVVEGTNQLDANDAHPPADATWQTLHAVDGTLLSLSAAGLWQILETPVHTRVRTTGGDGSTDVEVIIHAGRTAR